MKPFCKFFAQVSLVVFSLGLSLPGLADDTSTGRDDASIAAAAESGDPESQYLIGRRYYSGEEEAGKDYIKAVEWFRKAAESGHTGAQSYLGYIMVTVAGVATNPADGFR